MVLSNYLTIFLYVLVLIVGTVTATAYISGSLRRDGEIYKVISVLAISLLAYTAFQFLSSTLADAEEFAGLGHLYLVLSDFAYYIFAVCMVLLLEILSGNPDIFSRRAMIVVTAVYAIVVETTVLFWFNYEHLSFSFLPAKDQLIFSVKLMNLLYSSVLIYVGIRFLYFGIRGMAGLRTQKVVVALSVVFLFHLGMIIHADVFTGIYVETEGGRQLKFDPILFVFFAACLIILVMFRRKNLRHVCSYESMITWDERERWDALKESHRLTPREIEIMQKVFQGYSNPDIGKDLFIAENTVKRHMNHIFRKTETKSRYELLSLLNKEISK